MGQNLTKGTGHVMNLTYNELTNRINPQHGFQYDASGNVTAMPGLTNTYNGENRLTQVTHSSNGTEQYAYAPDGKRVWRKKLSDGVEHFHYYDVTGKLLGIYWIVGPGQVTTNDTAKYIYPQCCLPSIWLDATRLA